MKLNREMIKAVELWRLFTIEMRDIIQRYDTVAVVCREDIIGNIRSIFYKYTERLISYHIRLSPSFNAEINPKYSKNLVFSTIFQNNSFFLNFLISPEKRNLDRLTI